MKTLILLAALALSGACFAQAGQGTSAVTLSPFATATRVIESGIATITAGVQTALAPFATTLVSIENRGVAGKEQLRDELVALDRDMKEGLVLNINDVRQPALKELIQEIAADPAEVERINAFVAEGSELNRIATVVTLKLFY